MMRVAFIAALCVAAPTVLCQEDKKKAPAGAEMQNPKTKEHEALANMVGTWDCAVKMEALPGVPGMDKASESKCTETAELICNGLWLKSTMAGTKDGKPQSGVFIAGYDPSKKKYTGVWMSSDDKESGANTATGTYDAASKTWNWEWKSPMGEGRSTCTMTDSNKNVETCYMKGPDGKEVKFMEMTRTRGKAAPAPAKTTPSAGLSKEQEMVLKDVGEWEAVVKSTGGPEGATEEKGMERVTPICDGRWVWTDFTGKMMGAPFEGHGVTGWDPAQKKYVSLWIDSMSPYYAITTGTCDAAKKTCTLSGDSVCPNGDPMTIKQVVTWKDDNNRSVQMEFKSKEMNGNMTIDYKRKSQG